METLRVKGNGDFAGAGEVAGSGANEFWSHVILHVSESVILMPQAKYHIKVPR